jgi:signal transduction histidine kinase/ActR/RegA family two-component response regulator
MRRIRALVIGGSDRDVEALAAGLRRGGIDARLERADTLDRLQALLGESWDAVFAGCGTSAMPCAAALRAVQATGADVPFIVVSRRETEAEAVELMRAGAHDYVPLDDVARLVPAVERELRHAEERRRLVGEQRRVEAQLRHAHKMEALGRLAGGIAHDFNNLLTAVSGYSERILDRLPPRDPLRRDAREIRDAAMRASELTRQLLAFSRKEAHQPGIVDVAAVIAGIEGMLRRLIGEDIELTTSYTSTDPSVMADRGHVEQVVMNLVVNARDAMPRGGALRIATCDVSVGGGLDDAARYPGIEPGEYVAIEVSDTGHGMDAATLSHLFEPYFTTKEPGKGPGLGLSTVHRIVSEAGGFIRVTSAAGEGTTFRVLLPHADRPAARTTTRRAMGSLPRGSETVLLVEDEQGVRELIRDFLTRCGYAVIEAPLATDAIAQFERHAEEIALLITDVVMPQMNGRMLAERLLAARPTLKVLYMSGYTDDQLLVHEVAAGAGFIQKPFTPDVLARKVREVLDARPRRRGGADRRG